MNRQQRRKTKAILRKRKVTMVLSKDYDVKAKVAKFAKSCENLESGKLDLKFFDYAGVDLHGKDLKDRDFSYCDMVVTDLRNANLEYCIFAHANLSGADLSGAKIKGAIFYNAVLYNTKFDGCNKDEAFFDDEYLNPS